MKKFKWHGIPVNIPDSPKEWIFFGVIALIDLFLVLYLIVFKAIM
ncbi:MAG: hypothetical protein P8J51_03545 [Dehalococcoidia bacterium]|nr:hypothetical protein [Dehalococcoidia bacterium]